MGNAYLPNRSNVGVPDTGGLICGFVLHADHGAEPVDWDPVTQALPTNNEPLWLHFNLADTRAHRWIAACGFLPEAARDLFLDGDTHIRFEVVGQGLMGVLGDLHHDFDNDPEGLGVLCVYADEHRIITGRRHPLKAMDRLRRELLGGLRVAAPIDLLGHLIQDLAETFDVVVKALKEDVDEAEDRILAGHIHDQGIELGRVRRLLARLHRHASAGRRALFPALGRLPRWCSEAEHAHLHQAVERLDGLVQDLELEQERARLLQEEIAGRLGEATNRNLYILSIVTVALLPINLITGIFGMNTGGLPWSQSDDGFWWVMFWMISAVVGSLSILHWRKIF